MGLTKQEQIEQEDRQYAFYLMGLWLDNPDSDDAELDEEFAQAMEKDD